MPLPLETTVVCPALIGRTGYLDSLDLLVKQATRGEGQLVVLAGEAGIGKSRLIQEVVRKATATDHFQVLIGHNFEPDQNLPYASLLDLLHRHWFGFTPEKLREIFSNFDDLCDLVELLPEYSKYLPQNKHSVRLDPDQQKRRLFRAISNYFTHLAALHPVMIIFEDIHWCDENTLEFLLHLTHQISTKPLLILLTYRCDELTSTLNQVLAVIDRERIGHEFILSPLNKAEIGEMLREIFNLNRSVPLDFLELLHSLTEGNPFFIEEILRSLLSVGQGINIEGNWDKKSLQELHIPRSIQAVVQRRSEQLSPAAQALLALAAVVGRSFDFDLLQKLTDASEQSLLKLVRELLESQLVLEEVPERLVFRHALVQQAIYKRLQGRERKNLHQRIGRVLEELYAADLEAYQTDLAYHFFEAGEWSKAYVYALRSAQRAQMLYAPNAAIELFDQALDAAIKAGVPDIREIYRQRGNAFETSGDFERARQDHEQALILSRKIDLTAEWQSLLDLGMLWAGRNYELAGEYYYRAFQLASQIESPTCLAYSLNRLGNWHLNIEEPLEARRCHQEALAIFQRLNHPEGLAQTLDLLGMTCCLGGDLVLAHSYYRQAIAMFRELEDRNGLISSLASVCLCGPSLQTNTMVPGNIRIEDVIPEGLAAIKMARKIGKRSDEAYAAITLGFSYGMAGEYSLALKTGLEALAIAGEIEHHQWLAAAHYALGTIYLEMLCLLEAEQHLDQALAMARRISSKHWVSCVAARLSQVYTASAKFALAQEILSLSLGPNTNMETLGQRLTWLCQAELDFARGNFSSVIAIADRLIKSAANIDSRNEPVIPQIACLKAQALAGLALESKLAGQSYALEAEKLFVSTHLEAHRQGLKGLEWRTLSSLAGFYNALDRYEEAGELVVQARLIIKTLAGKIIDKTQKETFLNHTKPLVFSSSPPTTRKRLSKAETDQLTAREMEVAGLIVQGKSTRTIAEELVLSERTVETHVSNILAKLGLNSRVQLAAWAVENDLPRPTGK